MGALPIQLLNLEKETAKTKNVYKSNKIISKIKPFFKIAF